MVAPVGPFTNHVSQSVILGTNPPFLPPMSSKYQYTLILDLDETLIHYVDVKLYCI